MTDERFTVNISVGDGHGWPGETSTVQTAADVARTLRRIADRLDADGATGFYETIFDDNGLDIGRFKLEVER